MSSYGIVSVLFHFIDFSTAVAEDGVGYISLAGFSAGSGRDFHTALLALRSAAPQDLKGLVLDLRGKCNVQRNLPGVQVMHYGRTENF
jgi:hypothetical protein